MRSYIIIILIALFSCSTDSESISCVFSPTLTTQSADDITESSATVMGVIAGESEACDIAPGAQQGFVYATHPSPTIDDFSVSVYGTDISAALNNLAAETTYYVRTFISNSLGEWYGNDISFTTLSAAPQVNYGISQHNITFQGVDRNYISYIPESYDPQNPSPILFVFHGFGGQNILTMNNTKFNQIADSNNFIVIYPQGTLFGIAPHWNVGGWTSGSTVDDVAFVDHLLTDLSSEYNINLDRVYATGMSNGGFFSFLLACQLSDKFAAIASVTGSMTTDTFQNCNPSREVPILQIHGTNDIVVPYAGIQSWNTPINDVLSYWVNNNQCSTTPNVILLDDVDPNNGITVEDITYNNGVNQSVVKHLKVYGGGHEWYQNDDLDASEAVWTFFSNYDLNGPIN